MVLQRLGSHALAIAQACIALPALETATSDLKRSPFGVARGVSRPVLHATSFGDRFAAISRPI
jgi:hypothetical protein